MPPLRRPSFAVSAAFLALALMACAGDSQGVDVREGIGSPSADSSKSARKGAAKPGATKGTSKSGASTDAVAPGPGGTSRGATTTKDRFAGIAPKAGVYTYSQSGTTPRGADYPSRGTLRVARASAATGGARQTHVRQRVEEGDGRSLTYLFLKDRVALERFNDENYGCTLKPPLKVLPLPLKVGGSWTGHSECRINENLTLKFDITGSVTGTDTLNIGSVAVETFVVETTTKIEAGIYATITEKAKTWLSEKYRLIVRSETTSHSPAGTGRLVEQLLSVEPKG